MAPMLQDHLLCKRDWHNTSERIAVAEPHGCLVLRGRFNEVDHGDGVIVTAVNWNF